MDGESIIDPKFELGHVLFIDIVGYSRSLINEQTELICTLTEVVRKTGQVQAAEKAQKLVRLPTGDGMALVFRTTPEAPARCALEISKALKSYPNLQVRMGINSGPINEIIDVNERANIAGAGINIAQRVMDCGDAGHILLSQRVAEDLEQYREWQPRLHPVGRCEVKHGVIVTVVNLYTDELGNPRTPPKLKRLQWKAPARPRKPLSVKSILIGAAVLILISGLAVWQLRTQAQMKAELAKLRQGVVEYPQIDAQVRGSRIENNPTAEQERIYSVLGEQLGVDPKTLREKLPRFADELKKMPNAGTYERANASYVAKDYLEAERLALQVAADAKNRVWESSPNNGPKSDIVAALELAGLAAQRSIEYDRAMQHFRDAESFTVRSGDLEQWAILQQYIADLLIAQGKYGDAEKIYRGVIQVRSAAVGPDHPDTLDSRHRLIYALTRQSKYAEAETEARNVLRSREKLLGPEHIDTIVSRYNLAEPLVEQGKYGEAESLYREVIRLSEKVLGPEHPRTLAARVGLATVLGSEGKDADAEQLYREIIRLDQKVYGPQHPYTLNDRQNLATTLQAEGKYADAKAQYREVIAVDTKLVGAEHPDTLICRNNLAEVLDDEGSYADAEKECRQLVPIEQRVLGPENRLTLNTRGNLAVALIAQGKLTEAQAEYNDIMNRMERVLGLDHPDTLTYAKKFVVTLAHQNRFDDAKALAKQAQQAASQTLGSGSISAQNYAHLLADLEQSR
jgi:tetratricopeptide (TPR) repeat protein